jgi:hypothetical protein
MGCQAHLCFCYKINILHLLKLFHIILVKVVNVRNRAIAGVLVEKPKGKRSVWRLKLRWEDSIEIDIKFDCSLETC